MDSTVLGASCYRDGQIKAFILTRSRNSFAAVRLLHNTGGRYGFKDFHPSRTQSGFVQADYGKLIPRTPANPRDKSIRVDGLWTLSLFCKEQDSKHEVMKADSTREVFLESNLSLNPKTRTCIFFFESVQVEIWRRSCDLHLQAMVAFPGRTLRSLLYGRLVSCFRFVCFLTSRHSRSKPLGLAALLVSRPYFFNRVKEPSRRLGACCMGQWWRKATLFSKAHPNLRCLTRAQELSHSPLALITTAMRRPIFESAATAVKLS
jgi:hypothetical protein